MDVRTHCAYHPASGGALERENAHSKRSSQSAVKTEVSHGQRSCLWRWCIWGWENEPGLTFHLMRFFLQLLPTLVRVFHPLHFPPQTCVICMICCPIVLTWLMLFQTSGNRWHLPFLIQWLNHFTTPVQATSWWSKTFGERTGAHSGGKAPTRCYSQPTLQCWESHLDPH